MFAWDGGRCFLKLLTWRKDTVATRRERGYPGTGSRPMMMLPGKELKLRLEQSQLHLQGWPWFPGLLSG